MAACAACCAVPQSHFVFACLSELRTDQWPQGTAAVPPHAKTPRQPRLTHIWTLVALASQPKLTPSTQAESLLFCVTNEHLTSAGAGDDDEASICVLQLASKAWMLLQEGRATIGRLLAQQASMLQKGQLL